MCVCTNCGYKYRVPQVIILSVVFVVVEEIFIYLGVVGGGNIHRYGLAKDCVSQVWSKYECNRYGLSMNVTSMV